MNSDEERELMQPMGPPPRPSARPVALPRGNVWKPQVVDLLEPTPQRAPVPHSHPLAAFGAHKPVAQRTFQPISGKRLHPAFRNRAKIDAFLEKENQENDAEQTQWEETPVARVQVNSSRAIGIHRAEILAMQAPAATLSTDDRVAAATDASEWRRLAAQKQQQSLQMEAASNAPVDSNLARARARKVKKQVDPTWLQARQDVANHPRDPMNREDERYLREPLLRTRVGDLVASGVFFDAQDAARLRLFAPMTSLKFATAERASVPFYDAPWSW